MKYIFFLLDVYESWKELGTMDVTFRNESCVAYTGNVIKR